MFKSLVFNTIGYLFHYLIYNFIPNWHDASRQLLLIIQSKTFGKNTIWMILKDMINNPFSSSPPSILKSAKAINWKGIKYLGLFKLLLNIQMLISVLLYLIPLSIILWGPVRLLGSLGLINFLMQIPLFETGYFIWEKVSVNIINWVYSLFFQVHTNSWNPFGGPSTALQMSKGASSVKVDDIYNAVKHLKDIPKSIPIENWLKGNNNWGPLDFITGGNSLASSWLEISLGIIGLGLIGVVSYYAFNEPGVLIDQVLVPIGKGITWGLKAGIFATKYVFNGSISIVSSVYEWLPSPVFDIGDNHFDWRWNRNTLWTEELRTAGVAASEAANLAAGVPPVYEPLATGVNL